METAEATVIETGTVGENSGNGSSTTLGINNAVATPAVENTIELNGNSVTQIPAGGATGVTDVTQMVQAPALGYAHEILMAKHKIDTKSLPKELRIDLQFWNATQAKFIKSGSVAVGISLKKRSVIIADKILDWIEKDYPEKSEEEVQAHIKSVEEAKAKADADVKAKADADAKAKADADAKAKAKAKADEDARQKRLLEAREKMKREAQTKTEPTLEEKQVQMIKSGLDDKGKIHYDALRKILGRNIGLLPVKVGDKMVLHNEFGTNYYYIHK